VLARIDRPAVETDLGWDGSLLSVQGDDLVQYRRAKSVLIARERAGNEIARE
jgi:hypothetical protein